MLIGKADDMRIMKRCSDPSVKCQAVKSLNNIEHISKVENFLID